MKSKMMKSKMGSGRSAGRPDACRACASWSSRVVLLWVLCGTAAFAQFQAPGPDARDGQDPSLGLHLSGLVYYNSALPWKDVFRCSDSFRPSDSTFSLSLGRDGYPLSIPTGKFAWALCCVALDGNYPAGDYAVLWDGTGTVAVKVGEDCASWTQTGPRRGLATILPQRWPNDHGFQVQIVDTLPTDPVHNIRVMLRRFENDYRIDRWNPDFVHNVRRFGVLRFMNWGRETVSRWDTRIPPMVNWSDRCPPDYQTFGESTDGTAVPLGVPYEEMAGLGRRVGRHIWVSVPHAATDDFVMRMARLFKTQFSDRTEGLKVFVEVSSEVWNPDYIQHVTFEDLGEQLYGSRNYQNTLQAFGYRTAQVHALWAAEYGAGAPDELVRVLGSQFVNTWASVTELDTIAFDGLPVYKHVDALGVNPYFGLFLGMDPMAPVVRTWLLPQLITACHDEINGVSPHPNSIDIPYFLRTQHEIAETRINDRGQPVALLAYEGGQHLVGVGGNPPWTHDGPLNALFIQANRGVELASLIRSELLRLWKSGGVIGGPPSTTCQYFCMVSSVYRIPVNGPWYGFWGLKEFESQPDIDAPKFLAVHQWLENNPRWWQDP